jgi:hypothetical protein
MPAQSADKKAPNEGSILLAIQALQKDELQGLRSYIKCLEPLCDAESMATSHTVKPARIATTLLPQKRRFLNHGYYRWMSEAIH